MASIFGSDSSVTFTNVDNTISGGGQFGDGQMALVNEGTIIADGSNALVIDTGSNAIVNTGTLEALGLGGLVVHSDLVNEGVLDSFGRLYYAAANTRRPTAMASRP